MSGFRERPTGGRMGRACDAAVGGDGVVPLLAAAPGLEALDDATARPR